MGNHWCTGNYSSPTWRHTHRESRFEPLSHAILSIWYVCFFKWNFIIGDVSICDMLFGSPRGSPSLLVTCVKKNTRWTASHWVHWDMTHLSNETRDGPWIYSFFCGWSSGISMVAFLLGVLLGWPWTSIKHTPWFDPHQQGLVVWGSWPQQLELRYPEASNQIGDLRGRPPTTCFCTWHAYLVGGFKHVILFHHIWDNHG